MTKVQFDAIDPRILPDMSAKVSFLSQEVTAEQQKPLIAVQRRRARHARRRVRACSRSATARRVEVPVTPGIKVGDLIAITGDVKTGEKAVLKPAADLTPGAPVKVAQK